MYTDLYKFIYALSNSPIHPCTLVHSVIYVCIYIYTVYTYIYIHVRKIFYVYWYAYIFLHGTHHFFLGQLHLQTGWCFQLYIWVMWVKRCNKPPMTGNGNHITYYKHGDDWGMVQMALFYPHYWRSSSQVAENMKTIMLCIWKHQPDHNLTLGAVALPRCPRRTAK